MCGLWPSPFHSYIVSVNPLCVPAESICRAGTISPVQWQFGWRGLFLSQHPRWQLSGGAIQWCVIVYLGLLLSTSALSVDTFRLCQFGYTTLIKLLVAKTIIKYSTWNFTILYSYVYQYVQYDFGIPQNSINILGKNEFLPSLGKLTSHVTVQPISVLCNTRQTGDPRRCLGLW